jgi:hypothetical protein
MKEAEDMEATRKLIGGLTTAARIDGLPNRWLCSEISDHCDLPPETVAAVISRRTGVLVDKTPCRVEVEQEAGLVWVNVDPLTLSEMQA